MKLKMCVMIGALAVMPMMSANAGLFDLFKSGSGTSAVASAAANVAGDLLDTLSPEKAVEKLFEKCTTPTTDGICECVANATFGNLTTDQWRVLNHYIFDTRATVSVTDFVMSNPWLVTKFATPYFKCAGKN